MTELTVIKVWNDENNFDGLRPENLTVTLYANGQPIRTVTLNAANNWTVTVSDLPVYEAGEPIVYTWSEPVVEGYTTATAVDGTVTTFTNTHEVEKTELTIVKVWNDDNNRDGLRPESLTVTLYANGQAIRTVTLNAANNWTATVSDLPVMENGNPIVYTWSEPVVAGYTATATMNGTVTTLVNTHEPERTALTIVKVWDDLGNVARRPATVRMTLSNGQSVVLSAANDWQATISDLPVRANGVVIAYTWREQAVNGYTQSDYSVDGTVTYITNFYRPPAGPGGPNNPLTEIDDYDTPLGIAAEFNQVGHTFD